MIGCGVLRMEDLGRKCRGLGGTETYNHVNSLVNTLVNSEVVSLFS